MLQKGHSYLTELGVNALELLRAADSFFKRTWGYDTAHYRAPDWELGFPDGQAASTSNADLAAVVESCHRHGIRFFIDVVMAFAKNEANQWLDFDHFCLLDAHQAPDDPDAQTSGRGDGSQKIRDGFGSTLFRYARPLPQAAYDPMSGGTTQEAPARALLYSYVTRWMRDFGWMASGWTASKTFRTGISSRHIRTAPARCFRRDGRRQGSAPPRTLISWRWARN